MVVAVLFVALVPAGILAQISNPGGKLAPVSPDKIWPQTLQGSHYNEFWNYQIYLDDGTKVHIIYSVANFGSLKSPVSGVRLSVLFPGSNGPQIFQLSREYAIEHLIQDKQNNRMQLRAERDIFFEGKLPDTHRVRVFTRKDGNQYDIDLTFCNISPGYTRGSGKFNVNGEPIGMLTHIPYAEVTGYVAVNDIRKVVTGSAYMDHTYQYQTTTSLLNSGYRFVYHEDADNWDVIYFLLPDDGQARKTVGYRLYKRNGEVRQASIERITQKTRRRVSGKNIALTMEIEMDNGERLRITRSDDEETFSVLGELNWIARRAARTFLGGEVIDFRGSAHLLEDSQLPKMGEYNFFVVD
ncbi:MAG: hypothetical protein EA364_14630 [Balneolaceae bacterium]|nr:MAG: hypothetical protein EA364_14630 [Balneolaceae bacterium]